ncbi:hypothetical protein V5799_027762, partial [Amblyomma americanum]
SEPNASEPPNLQTMMARFLVMALLFAMMVSVAATAGDEGRGVVGDVVNTGAEVVQDGVNLVGKVADTLKNAFDGAVNRVKDFFYRN